MPHIRLQYCSLGSYTDMYDKFPIFGSFNRLMQHVMRNIAKLWNDSEKSHNNPKPSDSQTPPKPTGTESKKMALLIQDGFTQA